MSESAAALHRPELPFPLAHRGKVREVYSASDDLFLMVASDRVSAYDVVMSEPIPRKGEVLTQLTDWWLARLSSAAPHHLVTADPHAILAVLPQLADVEWRQWARRSMLVRRTRPLPVECVVRGYLAGSAWREYRDHGTLAGEPLPGGLQRGGPLAAPLFSPATKATEGHDENIRFDQVEALLGPDLASEARDRSFALYDEASSTAAGRGILLADTKFEFGVDEDGVLRLIDEVLTPDSSRYWPAEQHRPGGPQPSLDKQPVRDFLDTLTWDKAPPPPPLPSEVVESTSTRYLEIFHRLTGTALDSYESARHDGDGLSG